MYFRRLLRRLPCLVGLHAWVYNGTRLVSAPNAVPRWFETKWLCPRCHKTTEEIHS